MSTPSLVLPESLKKKIEGLAAKAGRSVPDFLRTDAGKEQAAMLLSQYFSRESKSAGRKDISVQPPDEAIVRSALVDFAAGRYRIL